MTDSIRNKLGLFSPPSEINGSGGYSSYDQTNDILGSEGARGNFNYYLAPQNSFFGLGRSEVSFSNLARGLFSALGTLLLLFTSCTPERTEARSPNQAEGENVSAGQETQRPPPELEGLPKGSTYKLSPSGQVLDIRLPEDTLIQDIPCSKDYNIGMHPNHRLAFATLFQAHTIGPNTYPKGSLILLDSDEKLEGVTLSESATVNGRKYSKGTALRFKSGTVIEVFAEVH